MLWEWLPSLFLLCLFEETQRVTFSGIYTSVRGKKVRRSCEKTEACSPVNRDNWNCFGSVKLTPLESLNRFSSNLALFLGCINLQDMQNPEAEVISYLCRCTCKIASVTMKVDKNYQLVKSELLLKVGVDSLLSGLILKVIRVKDTKNILAEWQTGVEVCRSKCFISAACAIWSLDNMWSGKHECWVIP